MMYIRRAYATTGDDKIVASAHALHGLDDIFLVVGNDFYPLQLDAEGEAELG